MAKGSKTKAIYAWDSLTPVEAERAIMVWEKRGPTEIGPSIGRFFIAWGTLELSVQVFLSEICAQTRADQFLALGGQLDLYQKTRALVALSFKDAPSEEWRTTMRDTASFITGKLRDYRNRMAHDFWTRNDDVISSWEFRPEVDKELKSVSLRREKVRTPQEIDHAAWKVASCGLQIKRLRDTYNSSKDSPIFKVPINI